MAPPGTGKSTVIETVVRQFAGPKRGIVARELLDESGKRAGFTSVDRDGRARQFMFYSNEPKPESIDGFNVDIEAIDSFVVPAIKPTGDDAKTLIYVDEIGRAQAKSANFVNTVRELLGKDTALLASVVYDDEPWAKQFKEHPDVCLLEVTAENRNHLPEILLAAYNQASAIRRLNKLQRERLSAMLKDLLGKGQFIAARKLFNNAVVYVTENKIVLKREQGTVRHYKIKGQTRDHTITWDRSAEQFTCDCDLANGRGDFTGKPEPCSHQLSLALVNFA